MLLPKRAANRGLLKYIGIYREKLRALHLKTHKNCTIIEIDRGF